MPADGFPVLADRLRHLNAPASGKIEPFALAAPFAEDEQGMPAREWIGGEGAFPRRKITAVAGPPGVSKTTAVLEICIGLAAGIEIDNLVSPARPERVLFGLVEDDLDEARRRVHAAASYFADTAALRKLVNDNLRLVDLADAVPLFLVTPEGNLIETAGFARLEKTVEEFKPAALVLDPLIEIHTAEENSNTALRPVLRRLRRLAADHALALLLIHHETKSAEGNALQRLRGGGGIGGAIRSLLSLRPMTPEEAKEFGVSEDLADLYIRIETGKQQYARKQKPRWLVTEEVQLANGDRVHRLLPWAPPVTAITPEMFGLALKTLRKGRAGEPCSRSPNSPAFVGAALETAGIPRGARAALLAQLEEGREVEWRAWRNPQTRKTNARLWVGGNGFEGWQQ